jgi:hypothetical protein
MTDERRRKTAAERTIDRDKLVKAQTRLNVAVAAFFCQVQDCGGYGDVSMRYYDRLKGAYERLSGPQTRINQTHVAHDIYNLPDDQQKTTSNTYFYDTVHSNIC